MLKKVSIFVTFLCICGLFTSCVYVNTTDGSEYTSLLADMKNTSKSVYSFFPEVADDCIDDLFLYYSDYDILDSVYSIYVNCEFTKEQYNAEKERVRELMSQWENLLEEDTDSFAFPSLSLERMLEFNNSQAGVVRYKYVLFNEIENRIVYVMIFEKELYGKSCHIPDDYLPKELVALRRR